MTAKRVLISIDERLLSRVDERVAKLGMTRSGYLAQLASADLDAARGPSGEATSRSSLAAIDEAFTNREA